MLHNILLHNATSDHTCLLHSLVSDALLVKLKCGRVCSEVFVHLRAPPKNLVHPVFMLQAKQEASQTNCVHTPQKSACGVYGKLVVVNTAGNAVLI